jgi:hypothetical protein
VQPHLERLVENCVLRHFDVAYQCFYQTDHASSPSSNFVSGAQTTYDQEDSIPASRQQGQSMRTQNSPQSLRYLQALAV